MVIVGCYARSLIHDHQKQIFIEQDLLHMCVGLKIVDFILVVMFKAHISSITISKSTRTVTQTKLYRSEMTGFLMFGLWIITPCLGFLVYELHQNWYTQERIYFRLAWYVFSGQLLQYHKVKRSLKEPKWGLRPRIKSKLVRFGFYL